MSIAKVIASLTLAFLVPLSEAWAGNLDQRPSPDLGRRHALTAGSEAAVEELREQGMYDSLVAAVEATRYRVSLRPGTGRRPDSYEGTNPAQRFQASFEASGVELRPTGERAGWRLGLRLRAWGYGERLEPPGAALIAASSNRVEYRYQAGGVGALTEWYVNTARGIEQGFTLAHSPAGATRTGPLTLVVAVTGDLAPRLAPGGQAIQLAAADGTAVLGYAGLHAWDATGRTLPSRLAVEAGQVQLLVEDEAAAYPVTVDPLVFAETKLTASDRAQTAFFGSSVAISGDTVVVGAPNHHTGGQAGAGQAYVYVRSGTAWREQAKLAASDGAMGDQFGFSVAISEDTVVVGAYGHATGGKTQAGQAYVYVRSGTTWNEQAKLAARDGAEGDLFGLSVAISGDTVVVGAWGHSSEAGQAYVYVRSGSVWSEQAKLAASDGAPHDGAFGRSVAISGDTVVVGAPYHNTGGTLDAGQAYVYVRSGAVWSEQAKLAASDGAMDDQFGWSVGISGDMVVVGARFHTTGPRTVAAGQAYVYVRSGAVWREQAILAARDGARADYFGSSVAISGDTVVVGAPFHTTGLTTPDAGQAYVYVRSGPVWSEQAKLTASDSAAYDFDEFGSSVAISGDTVVVGAPYHTTGGRVDAGEAYVYAPESDLVTILDAVFVNSLGLLFVSASSSAAPDAILSLTVPACVSDTPMVFKASGGGTYSFHTRDCSNLDGVTATVSSDHGGSATAVIK